MPSPRLQILLCGDFDDVEMRPVARAVEEMLPAAEFRRTPGLAGGKKDLPGGADADVAWTPDLIVVAQTRPEQFSQSDVRRLQARFPLARCVCCYGVWCESDGRNSTLWPDAVRVSARTAAPRIRREIEVLHGRRAPLPLTASRDEIFEFDSAGEWKAAGNGKAIRVLSPDREFKQTVEDLLKSVGWMVCHDNETVAELPMIVWDVDPWQDTTAETLREFHQQHPRVRIVALMNFGHPQATAEVMACGANAVVAKLGPVEQLFDALLSKPGERQKTETADESRRPGNKCR
jgi:hypothetical protein